MVIFLALFSKLERKWEEREVKCVYNWVFGGQYIELEILFVCFFFFLVENVSNFDFSSFQEWMKRNSRERERERVIVAILLSILMGVII